MDWKRNSTYHFKESLYTRNFQSEGTHRFSRYCFDDTLPLPKPSQSRNKRSTLEDSKGVEIQRNNQLLLKRITSIMQKPKREHQTEVKRKEKKSLNSGYQRKVSQQIEIENARILERIMKTKSQYDYGKRMERTEKTTRRLKIRRLPNMGRVETNPEMDQRSLMRLERILKLSNTTIHVTISLSKRGLLIQGRTKSDIIKIIEIPREEALDFVATQCDGRLQNIFGLLSYTNGTLYLKGAAQEGKSRILDRRGKYYTEGEQDEIQSHRVELSPPPLSIDVREEGNQ